MVRNRDTSKWASNLEPLGVHDFRMELMPSRLAAVMGKGASGNPGHPKSSHGFHASPWLIHTCSSPPTRSTCRRRMPFRMALPYSRCWPGTTSPGGGRDAVTDADTRDQCAFRDVGCAVRVPAFRASREDHAADFRVAPRRQGQGRGVNFGEHPQFTQAPRDQLGVLTAVIQDEDFFHGNLRASRRRTMLTGRGRFRNCGADGRR